MMMKTPILILWLFGIFVILSFLCYARRSKRPFFRAFLCEAVGVVTLCGVNLLAGLTGVSIPVTALSILTCAAGGVPGVALLIMLGMM